MLTEQLTECLESCPASLRIGVTWSRAPVEVVVIDRLEKPTLD